MASSKTIMEIQEEFGKRYPEREKTKKMGGSNISYIPWFEVISIANAVTEGHYDYRIVSSGHSNGGKYEMTVGVTIYAKDGTFYREGTGTEDSSTDNYGDYQSIAESMALRRAFTKFQLGIYMYRKG